MLDLINTEEVAYRLGVPPSYVAQMEEDGLIRKQEAGWRKVLRPIPDLSPAGVPIGHPEPQPVSIPPCALRREHLLKQQPHTRKPAEAGFFI